MLELCELILSLPVLEVRVTQGLCCKRDVWGGTGQAPALECPELGVPCMSWVVTGLWDSPLQSAKTPTSQSLLLNLHH